MYFDPNGLFRETTFPPLGGAAPQIFRRVDLGYLAHPQRGRGGSPVSLIAKKINFGLKFSVWTPITSGLVGISSPNFSRLRDELWSTNEKVMAHILTHPNCSYTVSWRKSIRHVVLFGVIYQLPLLRQEFRLSKLTFHSDLRRRAASGRALPRTSSSVDILPFTAFEILRSKLALKMWFIHKDPDTVKLLITMSLRLSIVPCNLASFSLDNFSAYSHASNYGYHNPFWLIALTNDIIINNVTSFTRTQITQHVIFHVLVH